MKRILLVTDGFFHPPLAGRLALRRSLAELDGFAFQHIRSLEKLPADLSRFAGLVLHFHHETLSDQALGRLEGFLHGGGGVLAIHAATASFKTCGRYFELLGGRFTGHGPVESFQMQPVRQDIFEGIGPFWVVDELYLHELQPGIKVHYTADHDGNSVPVIWTYQVGKGKVCYAVPGHTTSSMRSPAYQRLLRRGLEWVTG